jgi:hypothetical protein
LEFGECPAATEGATDTVDANQAAGVAGGEGGEVGIVGVEGLDVAVEGVLVLSCGDNDFD